MGKNDHCCVAGCENDRRYPERWVVKPHISAFDGGTNIRFWSCCNAKDLPEWNKAVNRKDYNLLLKSSKLCSNHFQYGRPTGVSPYPTLFLNGYGNDCHESKRGNKLCKPKPRDLDNTFTPINVCDIKLLITTANEIFFSSTKKTPVFKNEIIVNVSQILQEHNYNKSDLNIEGETGKV